MNYEYEMECCAWSALAASMSARGLAGWRLVSVDMHPWETTEAAPIVMVFWERVVPA